MTKTFTFSHVAGFNKALSHLPKECIVQITEASGRIAERVASEAASAATARGGVSALVAPTIKARKGRVPTIRMGGTRLIPRHRKSRSPRALKVNVDAGALNRKNQTIGNIIWGAEFGSDRFRQFSEWRGNKEEAGYFLWPTVRGDEKRTLDDYGDAVMRAVDAAARGAR